ncbi:MAG TPA: hypothetical protein VEQ37_05090 [Actinomycetota bacterium]|nr:hypothetical protein [Actinomycetota bacterium]
MVIPVGLTNVTDEASPRPPNATSRPSAARNPTIPAEKAAAKRPSRLVRPRRPPELAPLASKVNSNRKEHGEKKAATPAPAARARRAAPVTDGRWNLGYAT